MSFYKLVIISLGVILCLSGCGSIHPEQPINEIVEAPKIRQPKSNLNIPITIDLQPYFNETEKSVPKNFEGEEKNCEGVSYKYAFQREPIKFSGKGNHLNFSVDGKYWVKLNYCPQCTDVFASEGYCVVPRIYASCGVGEPLRRMSVEYSTHFELTKDYHFKTKTNLLRLDALDPCEVTFVHYDATKQLKEEVNKELKALEKDIDKEIQSIDLRTELEYVWNAVQDAMPIESYGYLYLNPSSPALSEINLDGSKAKVDLSLELRPVFSTEKYVQKPLELPNLQSFEKSKGFDMILDLSLNYDSISRIISSSLKDSVFKVKNKTLIINNVSILSASKNLINIQVDISGSKKGSLYLQGTPVFHSITQELSFPDLQFDIKTRSALLKTAKWIFNSRIEEELKKAGTINLTAQLSRFKNELIKELNTEIVEGVYMKGKISSLKIEDIYPLSTELYLRIRTEGSLSIEL